MWEFSPVMAFIIDMLVLSSNTVALKGSAHYSGSLAVMFPCVIFPFIKI